MYPMFEAKIRNKFHSCNLLCHVILSGGLSPESKNLQQIPPLATPGRNDSESLGGLPWRIRVIYRRSVLYII